MRPLPAVLLDLHDEMATGKLTLRRGRVSKSVDLLNGNPVSSTSTPRDETLGHYLVTSGVIGEEQHRLAVARATEVGGKLGEALVALRYMTVEQLIDQLGKQARHKLVQALRWPQGAWRFDETFDPVVGMQLRMVEVVLGGLRETAVEGSSAERLGRLDALTFELTERGVRLRHEIKRTFSQRLALALEQGASMGDLERALGDRAQARIAVDALVLCDAITVAADDVGLGAASVVTPAPVLLATQRAPTKPGVPLYDVLFSDLGTAVEGAAPLDFPEVTAAPDDSVVSVRELRAASSAGDIAIAARQTIAAEHQRAQTADHYALLLVGHRAPTEDIAAAFDARTAQLDNDSSLLADPLDKGKLAEIRTAYSTARATLLDERKRSAYDRELAGGELVQAKPSIDTELGFRLAEDMMAKRQWEAAIGHLRTVIARSPAKPDYQAALGWSEWNLGMQHADVAETARDHINQALAIDPDHAAAHDYKGRIDASLHADDAEALFHLERADRSRSRARRGAVDDRGAARAARRAAPARARAQAPSVSPARQGRCARGRWLGAAREAVPGSARRRDARRRRGERTRARSRRAIRRSSSSRRARSIAARRSSRSARAGARRSKIRSRAPRSCARRRRAATRTPRSWPRRRWSRSTPPTRRWRICTRSIACTARPRRSARSAAINGRSCGTRRTRSSSARCSSWSRPRCTRSRR